MTVANILVLIHGMTPQIRPSLRDAEFDRFLDSVRSASPDFFGRFDADPVKVSWGHEVPGQTVRPDQKLTKAQSFVGDRVNYNEVSSRSSDRNIIKDGLFRGDAPVRLVTNTREGIVQFGLADALYYASADGEAEVRKTVYKQVIDSLEPFRWRGVRLHIVAHSLGVTVAHDFLYGLFRPGDHDPDCLKQMDEGDAESFSYWRKRAQSTPRGLQLGTFISMASQLPIFVMRKQRLVDRLYNQETLDASVIGVSGEDVRWVNFYDVDDLLGFATRPLYGDDRAILEVQVDSGDLPGSAHTEYWVNKKVISESIRWITANCR